MYGYIKKSRFLNFKKTTCPDCRGSGKKSRKKLGPIKICPTCKGRGKIIA